MLFAWQSYPRKKYCIRNLDLPVAHQYLNQNTVDEKAKCNKNVQYSTGNPSEKEKKKKQSTESVAAPLHHLQIRTKLLLTSPSSHLPFPYFICLIASTSLGTSYPSNQSPNSGSLPAKQSPAGVGTIFIAASLSRCSGPSCR